jgi:hypothetical protein
MNDLMLISQDLTQLWGDEGYGAGDPIVDADLTSFDDIKASDVKNFKKTLDQFLKFMNDEQPARANYSRAANMIRSEENELRKFI